MPAPVLGPASDNPSLGRLATRGGRRLRSACGEHGGEGARRPLALGAVEMEEGVGEAESAAWREAGSRHRGRPSGAGIAAAATRRNCAMR